VGEEVKAVLGRVRVFGLSSRIFAGFGGFLSTGFKVVVVRIGVDYF
jgi:hypothetical protein